MHVVQGKDDVDVVRHDLRHDALAPGSNRWLRSILSRGTTKATSRDMCVHTQPIMAIESTHNTTFENLLGLYPGGESQH